MKSLPGPSSARSRLVSADGLRRGHAGRLCSGAFHRTRNFRDGTLKVVNLGDDADTTGAIYGQIAGAYYGVEAITVGVGESGSQ